MAVIIRFNTNRGGSTIGIKWSVLQLIGAKLGNTAILKGLPLIAVANACVVDVMASRYAAEPFVGFKSFAKKNSIMEVRFNAGPVLRLT